MRDATDQEKSLRQRPPTPPRSARRVSYLSLMDCGLIMGRVSLIGAARALSYPQGLEPIARSSALETFASSTPSSVTENSSPFIWCGHMVNAAAKPSMGDQGSGTGSERAADAPDAERGFVLEVPSSIE